MQWQGRRQSSNVEDARSGGGGRKMMMGGGLGTIVIALLILLFGGDLKDVMRVVGAQQDQVQRTPTSQGELTQGDTFAARNL